MIQDSILVDLESQEAVLTGSHFVLTSGLHSTAYINMRAIAHQAWWLDRIGREMATQLAGTNVDLLLGPETLGRTLAQFAAIGSTSDAIWCDIVQTDEGRRASFSPKFNFGRLVAGKRVGFVDDLLTSGSSIALAVDLVVACGGIPAIAVVAVRRTPAITEVDCKVPELRVLADVPGFETFSPEDCATHGPCSRHVPMVLRPGHGHKWIQDHTGYPVAA